MTHTEKVLKHKDKVLSQLSELCKKYGLVTEPEQLLTSGMLLNFDENGNLEPYAEKDFENGKKAGWFGDRSKEGTWASHLGD